MKKPQLVDESKPVPGEPLPEGAEADYAFVAVVLGKVADDEHGRQDRIESKIAVVIAGAFAALGFAVEKAGSIWGIIAAALYLVPTGLLLSAIWPTKFKAVPEPREFFDNVARFPKTSLRAMCVGLVNSYEENHPKLELKAKKLRYGIVGIMVVTCLVVGVKIVAAATGNEKINDGQRTAASTTRPPAASAPAANVGHNDHGSAKGRKTQVKHP